MIRYAIDSERKTIELLSGGSVNELKDVCKKYKDYSFTVSFARDNRLEKQGMIVGAAYVNIVGKIEHN